MNLNLTKRDGLKRQGFLTRHLRWLSPSLIALVVAVMFGAYAPVAKADSYNFSLHDTTDPLVNFSFSIPSTITPTSYPDADSFQLTPDSLKLDGIVPLPGVPVSFYDMADGGGLVLGDATNPATWIIDQGGLQLFTGDPGNPTGFNLGTFGLSDYGGAFISDNFTLTITGPSGITDVPTPEPSSLLLLGVGLLGMTGLIVYQQKRNGALLTEAKSPSGVALS